MPILQTHCRHHHHHQTLFPIKWDRLKDNRTKNICFSFDLFFFLEKRGNFIDIANIIPSIMAIFSRSYREEILCFITLIELNIIKVPS